ncbi:MAG: hypothetical protein Q4C96_02335 [Planctomycetia bacterium]|nr:hypothetical protein [Planctomycetia bacterium]
MFFFYFGFILGCGSTKSTGTARTATEQLILSDAMDRAVSQADFTVLAGKSVFIDSTYVDAVTDSDYLISLVRQHVLSSGCLVENDKEKAEYIVELRAGSVGTDQHNVLWGVPETSLPFQVPSVNISVIPEIALAKNSTQKAVVKLGIFAYHAKTGRPLWQSGNLVAESNAKNIWILGAGPIQHGEIYKQSKLAGLDVPIPFPGDKSASEEEFPVCKKANFMNNKEISESDFAQKEKNVETKEPVSEKMNDTPEAVFINPSAQIGNHVPEIQESLQKKPGTATYELPLPEEIKIEN